MSPLCLVLSDDLIDASRVIGHGRAAGLTVLQCRDLPALTAGLARRPALVILDLHHPGLDVEAVVRDCTEAGVAAVAYGPHVDAARLKAAREAGCGEVLPRSAFFERLAENLVRWTKRVDPPSEDAA